MLLLVLPLLQCGCGRSMRDRGGMGRWLSEASAAPCIAIHPAGTQAARVQKKQMFLQCGDKARSVHFYSIVVMVAPGHSLHFLCWRWLFSYYDSHPRASPPPRSHTHASRAHRTITPKQALGSLSPHSSFSKPEGRIAILASRSVLHAVAARRYEDRPPGDFAQPMPPRPFMLSRSIHCAQQPCGPSHPGAKSC